MTQTPLAELAIVGADRPPSPKPLTMGELIMPSYDWTRVRMYPGPSSASSFTEGYWTARIYQDTVALNDLYVLPHMRGKGLGNTLLDEVIAYANDLGLPVALYCAPGMNGLDHTALRAWYKRKGFITHPHFSHEHCEMEDLMLRYPDRVER